MSGHDFRSYSQKRTVRPRSCCATCRKTSKTSSGNKKREEKETHELRVVFKAVFVDKGG